MDENNFRHNEGSNSGDEAKADPVLPDAASSMESPSPDFEKLNNALSSVASSTLGAVPANDVPGGLLGELVEDMMDVLKRLAGIEESLARLGLRIDQVDARVYETGRSLAAEVATLRRDLLGERRSVLARGLFNAVVGHLDSLRAMRQGLQEGKDRNDKNNKRMTKQLEAVEITLVTALQGMGFQEFHVRAGDPFSPVTMECLGYVKGEPRIVLRAVRSGFEAPEGIIRPAGVYIAEPFKGPGATNA